MAWCLVKAQGQLYFYLYLINLYSNCAENKAKYIEKYLKSLINTTGHLQHKAE